MGWRFPEPGKPRLAKGGFLYSAKSLDLLSPFIRQNYEVHEWKHPCAILKQDFAAEWTESLRIFRSCPLITPKDAQSSLQMLAIARYGCALRLDRTPVERAARSRPKNSQALTGPFALQPA